MKLPVLPEYVLHPLAVLKRAVLGFNRDDGAALAGYMAYTALLAIFPFLIFATALLGLLIGEENVGAVVDFLFDVIPEHVAKTLEPALHEVVDNRSLSVLSFSPAVAIYVASSGVEALRIALERAYGMAGRANFLISRLVSIGFTLAGVAAFGVLALFLIVGPILFDIGREILRVDQESLSFPFDWIAAQLRLIDLAWVGIWHWTRFLGGAAIMLGFLFALHRWLPQRRPDVPIRPGIVLTAALWIALASLFSVYFRYAPSYSVTYGTLAGVIVTLLFFYLSSAIFIFGAEVNAALADPRAPEDQDGRNDLSLL